MWSTNRQSLLNNAMMAAVYGEEKSEKIATTSRVSNRPIIKSFFFKFHFLFFFISLTVLMTSLFRFILNSLLCALMWQHVSVKFQRRLAVAMVIRQGMPAQRASEEKHFGELLKLLHSTENVEYWWEKVDKMHKWMDKYMIIL